MERPAIKGMTALGLWARALIAGVRSDGPDLTARQLAVLLCIYIDPPPHTVRGLAARLRVAKPVITRAVQKLEALGLAKRKQDEADKRSILVQRTVKGSVYLSDFAARIESAYKDLENDGI